MTPAELAEDILRQELGPWEAVGRLLGPESHDSEGDRLVQGYVFRQDIFGENAFEDVKNATERAMLRVKVQTASQSRKAPKDGRAPTVHLKCRCAARPQESPEAKIGYELRMTPEEGQQTVYVPPAQAQDSRRFAFTPRKD